MAAVICTFTVLSLQSWVCIGLANKLGLWLEMAESMDTQSHTEDSLVICDMSVCPRLKIAPTINRT